MSAVARIHAQLLAEGIDVVTVREREDGVYSAELGSPSAKNAAHLARANELCVSPPPKPTAVLTIEELTAAVADLAAGRTDTPAVLKAQELST